MSYYAKIYWQQNVPFSDNFGDIYFSTKGIEEKIYVFIKHNDLINRFKNTTANEIFTIAETGFGAGLSFLITLKLWQELANPTAQLFFISFEKYPISHEDLKKIHNNFPELEPQINELLSQYYIPTPATHRLSFKNNVFLNLVVGDINSTITQQQFAANAWFLDGFTPNKNQDIWSELVIKNIKRLSKPGTSFATFSANSQLRKLLTTYGFNVKKDKGYNKREMLFGELSIGIPNISIGKPRPTNWFSRYENTNPDKHVIIIGGGISGASTAYSLANRGYKVTLYEAHAQLAAEASGNSQGILYGSFSGNYTPMLELSLAGYRYSHWLINKLLKENIEYANCGVLQLGYSDKIRKQQQQILTANLPSDLCYQLDYNEICAIAGLKVNSDSGLFFPYGLWVDPRKLVQNLVNHSNITVKLNTNIATLIQLSDCNWQIVDSNNNITHAPNVVLCNSHAVTKFTQLNSLYLRKIRGQISEIPHNNKLRTVLCNSGYVTPSNNNQYIIGATFKFQDTDTLIKHDEQLENINNFTDIITDIVQNINLEKITGRASIRCSTTDYAPLVGPVADYDKFKDIYKDLSKDSNYWINQPCPYLKGLFINVAHGAKGILTAPICGEIIADYINNTPLPISESTKDGLHPNRFWRNELIKGKFN